MRMEWRVCTLLLVEDTQICWPFCSLLTSLTSMQRYVISMAIISESLKMRYTRCYSKGPVITYGRGWDWRENIFLLKKSLTQPGFFAFLSTNYYFNTHIPCLPMYNAHPDFEACFQKLDGFNIILNLNFNSVPSYLPTVINAQFCVQQLIAKRFLKIYSSILKSNTNSMIFTNECWFKLFHKVLFENTLILCFVRFLLLFYRRSIERNLFSQHL